MNARSLRIVMVNDEPGVLKAFELVIGRWFKDVTILSFENGATALEELLITNPDLLITDDRMPVMAGQELCQRLLDKRVTYPIIVDSAWEPTEQWVREFANLGLNVSFLPVPCDIESILKAVETVLKIQRLEVENPQENSMNENRYQIVLMEDFRKQPHELFDGAEPAALVFHPKAFGFTEYQPVDLIAACTARPERELPQQLQRELESITPARIRAFNKSSSCVESRFGYYAFSRSQSGKSILIVLFSLFEVSAGRFHSYLHAIIKVTGFVPSSENTAQSRVSSAKEAPGIIAQGTVSVGKNIGDRERRAFFHVTASAVGALLATAAYCLLAGHWSGFVGLLVLFGLGIYSSTHFGSKLLRSRSLLWIVLAATLSTGAICWDFSGTTSETTNVRYGAVARDGWISHATGSGACNHHGGVDHWLTYPVTHNLKPEERWSRVFGQLWFLLPFICCVPILIVEKIIFNGG
jgi:FixJ family two-component response regulator